MSENINSEQNLLANVRLCDAIKWHPCLYDSKSKVYQMKHAVDAAWQSISNECEDTVANCKLRWRIIRKSFLRSFRKNVPYNRYYLNDYLDFLKPHLPTLELNEAQASKAEDYDIIQLVEKKTNRHNEEEEEEEEEDEEEGMEEDNDAEDNAEQQHDENDNDHEDNGRRNNNVDFDDETNDGEVVEYQLNDETIEDPEEDSDTASAEETHKVTRVIRSSRGKRSNVSTPNLDDAEDEDNVSRDDSTERIGHRLVRTRKANSRYMEYDVYDRRYKKGAKAEEKRKAEKRLLENVKLEKAEIKQDEKRQRRSMESPKFVVPTSVNKVATQSTSNPSNREEMQKPKLLGKKLEIKLPKPKTETLLHSSDIKMPKPVSKEVIVVRKSGVKIDKNLNDMPRNNKPKMVDNSTNCVTTTFVDRGSQHENDEPRSVDDDFADSLKPQMALMNSRQKFNFKKKVFQALMDVFDDSSNFPNKNEILQMPTAEVPRLDNSTTGELRLMRELVSLITAAKSTPEIMNAKEKVTVVAEDDDILDIEDLTTSPSKATNKQIEKPSTQTPAPIASTSTGSSSGTVKKSETLGLPHHILQKVVKVAGSNGGTIMTHEGDKRRVYRIYPKGAVPSSVANNTKGSGNSSTSTSIGTFYVTPPKSQMPISNPSSNIVRTTVGNHVNGKPITFTTITKSGSIVTGNNSSSVSTVPSSVQKVPITSTLNKNPQLVVTRQRITMRPQGNIKSPLQNKVVTSTNPQATAAHNPESAYPLQRFSTASSSSSSSVSKDGKSSRSSGLTNIQISQAVSLNTAAANENSAARENSVKAFLSSGHESDTCEGNSGDSSIFPDNPQTEDAGEEGGNSKNLLNAQIKDEPLD